MPSLTRKLCTICGESFATREVRDAHVKSAHPGKRMGWGLGTESRRPAIIDERTGERTIVPAPDYQRWRRAALQAGAADRAPTIVPQPEPGTGAGTIPPPASPAPPGGRSRPFVAQPPLTLSKGAAMAGLRADVRENLTVELLADVVRDLSAALSEADGAGDAGTFNRVESMMIARLLYDPTVDFIISRFAGNVNRFKLGMAAILILVSKGRVHLRAVLARAEEARGRFEARDVTPPEEPESIDVPAGPAHVMPAEPEPIDPIAELAARQAAERGRG